MPVFRFAPSPNGQLHLGHALSALLNSDRAREASGRFLLRIEDIDAARCTPQFEADIYRDLAWLGLRWEEPVRRQSEHLPEYEAALSRLTDMGLVYPAFLTRGEVKARVAAVEQAGGTWPRDPDGTPLYPEDDRHRSDKERRDLMSQGLRHAFRLDMQKALELIDGDLFWTETGGSPDPESGTARILADPSRWGDVILSRSDAASSYHLSVTVDDAAQGITHVVRGLDLFEATAVHRVLQVLLDLPEPIYQHHRLILGPDGRKLSKSGASTGLATLRDQGLDLGDIRRLVGL